MQAHAATCASGHGDHSAGTLSADCLYASCIKTYQHEPVRTVLDHSSSSSSSSAGAGLAFFFGGASSSSESAKLFLTPVDSTMAPSLEAIFSLLMPPFLPFFPFPLPLPLPSLPLPSLPLPSLPLPSFPLPFPSLPLPPSLSPAFFTTSHRPAYSFSLNSKALFKPSSLLYSMKAMPLGLPSSFMSIFTLSISPHSVKSLVRVSSVTS
mmetsp:Transcript_44695/g.95224  ORF Transcript_44695/g.95224 Transcript_44695/m.95224 type:complete len:208 (+) Transcript_44695:154-777(+)